MDGGTFGICTVILINQNAVMYILGGLTALLLAAVILTIRR